MRVALLSITLSVSCAGGPHAAGGASDSGAVEKAGTVSREELLQELAGAAQEFEVTASQGQQHWQLVQRVLKSGALIGLTKGQIFGQLGPSRRCPSGMVEAEQRGPWVCYPIGKLHRSPWGSYGGTIELGVQFSKEGLSISTKSVRMQ